jgi:adenylylsulfate kinase-like enzyme
MIGKCYWITGLSATGKTTLSTLLVKELRASGKQIIHFDGDDLRKAFSEKNYNRKDRVALGMRYAKLCNLLCNQGIDVVIAVIGLYKELHHWNRKNIINYVEIFIDTPLQELIKRDPKGLYKAHLSGELPNIAGMDLKVDFPENPDIHIKWKDGKSVQSMYDELIKKINLNN